MDDNTAGATRRSFLRYGAACALTATAGASAVLGTAHRAAADLVRGTLVVSRGTRTMIDGLVVPVVGFGGVSGRVELPAGRLEVQVGDTVELTIRNATDLPTGFAVPGLPGATAPPVPPGATRRFSFRAPSTPGTYFYVGTVSGSAAHRAGARRDRCAAGPAGAGTARRSTRATPVRGGGPPGSRCSAPRRRRASPSTSSRSAPGCSAS